MIQKFKLSPETYYNYSYEIFTLKLVNTINKIFNLCTDAKFEVFISYSLSRYYFKTNTRKANLLKVLFGLNLENFLKGVKNLNIYTNAKKTRKLQERRFILLDFNCCILLFQKFLEIIDFSHYTNKNSRSDVVIKQDDQSENST